MLLALVVLVGAPKVFGRYLSDLTLPVTLNDQRQQYAEAEGVTAAEKCLSSGKILYENRCHELLTDGPCGDGQWLVLDDRWYDGGGDGEGGPLIRLRAAPTARCARRRCSESDVYWPRDGFCYDADTARRRRLCPGPGAVLATDEFGDGRCACLDHDRDGEVPHVRLRPADRDGGEDDAGPCYAAYTRGPCRRGHVIVPSALGYGNCTEDPCAEKRRWPQPLQQLQQQQQFRDRTPLALWTDGLCYELGTRGPCADQEKFSVARDAVVAQPACVATVALQLDLFSDKRTTEAAESAEPPCKTDHRGECVDGVDVPVMDAALAFKEQLLESARRRAQRNEEKKRKRTSNGKR